MLRTAIAGAERCPAGLLYDSSGSYTLAFILFSAFWLIGFVLILLARPPQRG